jgi:hypothetical protein
MRSGKQPGATMKNNEQEAVDYAASCLGLHGNVACEVLSQLWELAFEHGRLTALDEMQDRFCVCTK